jgi:hypothetical protein
LIFKDTYIYYVEGGRLKTGVIRDIKGFWRLAVIQCNYNKNIQATIPFSLVSKSAELAYSKWYKFVYKHKKKYDNLQLADYYRYKVIDKK